MRRRILRRWIRHGHQVPGPIDRHGGKSRRCGAARRAERRRGIARPCGRRVTAGATRSPARSITTAAGLPASKSRPPAPQPRRRRRPAPPGPRPGRSPRWEVSTMLRSSTSRAPGIGSKLFRARRRNRIATRADFRPKKSKISAMHHPQLFSLVDRHGWKSRRCRAAPRHGQRRRPERSARREVSTMLGSSTPRPIATSSVTAPPASRPGRSPRREVSRPA